MLIIGSILRYEVLDSLSVLFCGVTIVSICEDHIYPLLTVEPKSTHTVLILEITFFKVLPLVVHEFSPAIVIYYLYF